MNKNIKKLIYSAMCLALCLVLPFLTGQIPEIGKALSPMHIPVFLCGFLCGWPWAPAVGALAPILRSLLFGMPKIYPDAVCMMFELATYGLVTGILYKVLPKNKDFLKTKSMTLIALKVSQLPILAIFYMSIYVALLAGMVAGRIVWGIAKWVLLGLAGTPFTMQMFMAGAILNAIPGIILHIVLIPVLVMALEKAGLIENNREN